mgnify:CR=1 FL=1
MLSFASMARSEPAEMDHSTAVFPQVHSSERFPHPGTNSGPQSGQPSPEGATTSNSSSNHHQPAKMSWQSAPGVPRSNSIKSESELDLYGPLEIAGSVKSGGSINFNGDFSISDKVDAYGGINLTGNSHIQYVIPSLSVCGTLLNNRTGVVSRPTATSKSTATSLHGKEKKNSLLFLRGFLFYVSVLTSSAGTRSRVMAS